MYMKIWNSRYRPILYQCQPLKYLQTVTQYLITVSREQMICVLYKLYTCFVLFTLGNCIGWSWTNNCTRLHRSESETSWLPFWRRGRCSQTVHKHATWWYPLVPVIIMDVFDKFCQCLFLPVSRTLDYGRPTPPKIQAYAIWPFLYFWWWWSPIMDRLSERVPGDSPSFNVKLQKNKETRGKNGN